MVSGIARVASLVLLQLQCTHGVVDGTSCGNTPGFMGAPGVPKFCMDWAGKTREWSEHRPSGVLDSPVKIVVDMHGHLGSIDRQRLLSGWMALAEKARFIVVWPTGLSYYNEPAPHQNGRSWRAGDYCCGAAVTNKTDDVGFLKAMVTLVAAKHNADVKKHVYWTGHSNGGSMANYMAAQANEIVAGVASFAQYLAMHTAQFNSVKYDKKPVPIIQIHGKEDPVAKYENWKIGKDSKGKELTLGAMTDLKAWAKFNKCANYEKAATTCSFKNYSSFRYSLCAGNTEVVHIAVSNTGHLPYKVTLLDQATANTMGLGKVQATLDTTAIAWDFLKQFPTATVKEIPSISSNSSGTCTAPAPAAGPAAGGNSSGASGATSLRVFSLTLVAFFRFA